ncbi:MAG TPA: hypothetical protein VHU84_13235 [Lacipirellulaceae bacterium]|nr:hypothetical protein [Lacipirellulaceae bacterium]
MTVISAEEWQVLSFFEVGPKLRDSEVPWCFNDAVYEVRQNDLALSVAIAPSYFDVRIILKHRDSIIYELNAMSVEDVCYGKEDGRETLQIKITERESLTIRIKPHIEIQHVLKE